MSMDSRAALVAMEQLSMETSMLVATARAKNVDLGVWFALNEATQGGKIDAKEFNSKVVSLGLTIGMEEDWETKKEIELATSSSSLASILALCGCGQDAKGNSLIDVDFFITIAQLKMDKFLAENPEDEEEEKEEEEEEEIEEDDEAAIVAEDEDENEATAPVAPKGTKVASSSSSSSSSASKSKSPVEAETTIGSKSVLGSEVLSYGAEEFSGEDVDTFVADLKRAGGYGTSGAAVRRPGSAPVGKKGMQNNEKFVNTMSPHSPPRPGPGGNSSATATILPPDSPYDEEVAFNLEEEEEAETTDGYTGRARKTTSSSSSLSSSRVESTNHRNSRISSSSTNSDSRPSMVSRSRPSSSSSSARAPVVMQPKATTSRVAPPAIASKSTMASTVRTSTRPKSASGRLQQAHRHSMGSFGGVGRSKGEADFDESVEEMIRNVVRQTDLYHLVQVHLGYIETYTMVPPRGLIVSSNPRPWLSLRELKVAFLAGRVRLSDAHVFSLMKLVAAFASEKRGEHCEEGGTYSQQATEHGKAVIASGQRLSAEWLKKYLVHLRLTKRGSLVGSSNAWGIGDGGDEAVEGGKAGLVAGGRSSRDHPIEWQEWLGHKLVGDKLEASGKPKEFRKALAGRPYRLTKEEINEALFQNNIFPEDLLKNEVDQMVRAWVLDVNGRMDFNHVLNVEIRKWQKANSTDWRRVKEEKRREVESELKRRLVEQKKEALLASERTDATITKSLFWKFDKQKCGLSWGAWLKKNQQETEKQIAAFRKDQLDRNRFSANKNSRKLTVASLTEVESKLGNIQFNTFHSIELRKSLVNLRREALAAGVGKGELVTKAVFDKHLEKVLAPRLLELPAEMRGLAAEARHSHEGVPCSFRSDAQFHAVVDTLFRQSEAEAVARELELNSEKIAKKTANFDEWLMEKKKKEKLKEEEDKKKAEEEEKRKRNEQKKARKAYKQWVAMRKQNKYISKPDGKDKPATIRELPTSSRVEHKVKWSKDTENLARAGGDASF